MASPLCPSCGGQMVPGDRIAEPKEAIRFPFPAPPELVITKMLEEYRAVWICPNPECVHQAVQRVF